MQAKLQSEGTFRERENGHYFPFMLTLDDWPRRQGLAHKILINGTWEAGTVRYGNVFKTRAHVAVDEDPSGGPVLNTWNITQT